MKSAIALLLCGLLAAPALHAQDDPQSPNPSGERRRERRIPRRAPSAQPQKDVGEFGARYGQISPDGKTMAFSLHGDIWTVPVEGGRASRVTRNEANEIRPAWSPDGTKLAFGSDRSGSWDVWEVSAEGGIPKRLSEDAGLDLPLQYLDDGKSMLIQSTRFGSWQLFSLPLSGGTPTLLTVDTNATLGVKAAGDDYIYYQYTNSDAKRKGYRGSANDELYRALPGEVPEVLTSNRQNDRDPQISPDGKKLYFTRETGESGKDFNIFVMDIETREEKQVTELNENGASYLSLSPDGKTAVFTWKFLLYTVDLTAEKAEPKLVKIEVEEDPREAVEIEQTFTNGAENVDISKDGRNIAFNLAGQIWIMSADGGEARAVTEAGMGDTMPRWSPDGSTIAFYSAGRTGNSDLFLLEVASRRVRQLTQNPEGDFFHNWAPDGSYLVYTAESNGVKNIWRLPVAGGRPVQLTNTPYADDDASVSADGQWIAFDSQASGDADIYVMRTDGTGRRRVYGTPGAQEESPRFSPDGSMLVFNRSGGRSSQVVVTNIGGTGEVTIGAGNGGSYLPDGQNILFTDSRGSLRVVRAPDTLDGGGRSIPFLAKRKVKERDQFVSAFNEAWGLINTQFYEGGHHGVNWNSMKARYEPLVKNVQTRQEFYWLVTSMIGELNASHQGISGNTTRTPGYTTGGLGAIWNPETMDDQPPGGKDVFYVRLKVKDVQKDGPIDKAWIRDGDFIFGINGKRLTSTVSAASLLKDTVGKPTKLMVGAAEDGSDMRTVEVTPESDGAARGRQYAAWVKTNKDAVKKGSDGKLAYIHIPAMNPASLQRFYQELSSEDTQRSKALVLDVRNNGGGNIHNALIDALTRRKYAINYRRNSDLKKSPTAGRWNYEPSTPARSWERPIVLLINDRSFSDAEVFPHAFKTLELGTIIGVPTPGAVIGTVDQSLSDGSRFRVTMLGFRNLDGTNQEGNGAEPDILVEHTPEDRVMKRDTQLSKAIEVALSKVSDDAPAPAEAATEDGDSEPKKDEPAEKSQSAHAIPEEDLPDSGIDPERFVIYQ